MQITLSVNITTQFDDDGNELELPIEKMEQLYRDAKDDILEFITKMVNDEDIEVSGDSVASWIQVELT